jgi:hypothetical protein
MKPSNFFSTSISGWDSIPIQKTQPIYEIDGDFVKFPISKKYTLFTPSNGLRGYKGTNIDVLIETFLTDEDALFSWLLDYNVNPTENKGGFMISETTSIQILKYEDGGFLEHEILTTQVKDSEETLQLVLNHPSFNSLVQRAEEIAKENEKNAILEFNDRKKTLRLNNFKMWQTLHEKYLAGEFNEFFEETEKTK